MTFKQEQQLIESAKKIGAIEELEEIKTEIKYEYETNKYFGVEEYDRFIEILNGHILKLKGEEYEPDDWDSLANAERDH